MKTIIRIIFGRYRSGAGIFERRAPPWWRILRDLDFYRAPRLLVMRGNKARVKSMRRFQLLGD
jgi:hypothetical protein